MNNCQTYAYINSHIIKAVIEWKYEISDCSELFATKYAAGQLWLQCIRSLSNGTTVKTLWPVML